MDVLRKATTPSTGHQGEKSPSDEHRAEPEPPRRAHPPAFWYCHQDRYCHQEDTQRLQ